MPPVVMFNEKFHATFERLARNTASIHRINQCDCRGIEMKLSRSLDRTLHLRWINVAREPKARSMEHGATEVVVCHLPDLLLVTRLPRQERIRTTAELAIVHLLQSRNRYRIESTIKSTNNREIHTHHSCNALAFDDTCAIVTNVILACRRIHHLISIVASCSIIRLYCSPWIAIQDPR